WIAERQWTQQDQQELARQNNAVGELLRKRDSGEVSEEEFYHMAGNAAPRINALEAKQKYTAAQALEEQRKAHADAYAASAAHRNTTYESARKHTQSLAREKDPNDPSKYAHPELQDPDTFAARVQKEFQTQLGATSAQFGGGEKKAAAERHQELIGRTELEL